MRTRIDVQTGTDELHSWPTVQLVRAHLHERRPHLRFRAHLEDSPGETQLGAYCGAGEAEIRFESPMTSTGAVREVEAGEPLPASPSEVSRMLSRSPVALAVWTAAVQVAVAQPPGDSYTVISTVRDANTKEPIAHARVSTSPVRPGVVPSALNPLITQPTGGVETGEDGRFLVARLKEGRYSLTASADGYRTFSLPVACLRPRRSGTSC